MDRACIRSILERHCGPGLTLKPLVHQPPTPLLQHHPPPLFQHCVQKASPLRAPQETAIAVDATCAVHHAPIFEPSRILTMLM